MKLTLEPGTKASFTITYDGRVVEVPYVTFKGESDTSPVVDVGVKLTGRHAYTFTATALDRGSDTITVTAFGAGPTPIVNTVEVAVTPYPEPVPGEATKSALTFDDPS